MKNEPYTEKTVTAIGFFDGTHLAHAALLKETVRLSRELGLCAALFTFADMPKGGASLSTLENRLHAFEAYGIETVFIADFASLCSLCAEDFVKDVLVGICRAEAAVCGFNFRFGKGAAGDAALLKRLLPKTEVLAPVEQDGSTVSSSRIRALIAEGKVEEAARLLGAPYTLCGRVEHGKALGRRLGFPTANIRSPLLLPKNGVYETRVDIDGVRYAAMSDVGNRPTVEGQGERRIETYILNFDGDLYGKEISVAFVRRLRDEIAFESEQALLAQLKKDAEDIERKATK